MPAPYGNLEWLQAERDGLREENKRLRNELRECAHALGIALTHGHPPGDPNAREKFEAGWSVYRKLSEQGIFAEPSAPVAESVVIERRQKTTEELAEIERAAAQKIICDCGTPGCNKVYDHRRGSGGFSTG